MRLLKTISLLLVCFITLQASIVVSAEPGDSGIPGSGSVATDYPGRGPGGNIIIDVAHHYTQRGLIYYYKLHGDWPQSWQQVRDEQLFQVDLVAYGGDLIDPDDSSVGFFGQVYYDSYSSHNSSNGKAHLREQLIHNGPIIKLVHVEPPVTYADLFAKMDQAFGEEQFTPLLNEPGQMRFFALLGMIQGGIGLYDRIYGHPPYTWQDYLDSGLAPIDENSVNPLTGGHIYADGRANNFIYKYIEDMDTFYFRHILHDGSEPTVGFGY